MTSVFRYSFDSKKEKLGLAQAHDVNASYKDLTQVCNSIRRQPIQKAKKILEEAIELTKAIPFRKFNKGMGHRSELGGRKGKYPKKECKIVLLLVNNAEANAGQKGLEKDLLYVKHAAAYKQNVFKRYRKYWAGGQTLGYGKQAIWAKYVTARVEIALAQHGAKKETVTKTGEKKAKTQAKESKASTKEKTTEKKSEHSTQKHENKEPVHAEHKAHEAKEHEKAHEKVHEHKETEHAHETAHETAHEHKHEAKEHEKGHERKEHGVHEPEKTHEHKEHVTKHDSK